jgi:hypothetical protein
MAAYLAGIASAGIGGLIINDQLVKRGLIQPSTYTTAPATMLNQSVESLSSALNVNFKKFMPAEKTDFEMTKEEEMKVEMGRNWNKGVKEVRKQLAEITKYF